MSLTLFGVLSARAARLEILFSASHNHFIMDWVRKMFEVRQTLSIQTSFKLSLAYRPMRQSLVKLVLSHPLY